MTAWRVQSPKFNVSDNPISINPGHTWRRSWQRPKLPRPIPCYLRLAGFGLAHSQKGSSMYVHIHPPQAGHQPCRWLSPHGPTPTQGLLAIPILPCGPSPIIPCLGADPTARNLFDHTLTTRTWHRHRNPAAYRW